MRCEVASSHRFEAATFSFRDITLGALPNRREGLAPPASKLRQTKGVEDSTMRTDSQLQIKSARTAATANQVGTGFERAQTPAHCERPYEKQSHVQFHAGLLKRSRSSRSGACAKETQ